MKFSQLSKKDKFLFILRVSVATFSVVALVLLFVLSLSRKNTASADTVDYSTVTFDTGCFHYNTQLNTPAGSSLVRCKFPIDYVSNSNFPLTYIGQLSNSSNTNAVSGAFTISLSQPSSNFDKHWSTVVQGVEGFSSLFYADVYFSRSQPSDLNDIFYILFHNAGICFDLGGKSDENHTPSVLSLTPSFLQYGYGDIFSLLGTNTFSTIEVFDQQYQYPNLSGLLYFRRYCWLYDVNGSPLTLPVSIVFAYPIQPDFAESDFFLDYFAYSYSVMWFSSTTGVIDSGVDLTQYYADLTSAYNSGRDYGYSLGYTEGVEVASQSPFETVVSSVNSLLATNVVPGISISILLSFGFGITLLFVVIRLSKG